MPQIIWSKRVVSDIERIYKFYLEYNELIAEKAKAVIYQEVNVLVDNPEIAPIVNQNRRCLIIKFGKKSNFKMYYRYDGDRLIILSALYHNKELVQEIDENE